MGSTKSVAHVETVYTKPATITLDDIGRDPLPDNRTGFHERYCLAQKLGKGAFATVYSISDARKEFSDEELVVKIIDLRSRCPEGEVNCDSGQPPNDPKTVKLLAKEIDIMRKLSGVKHCVRLVDYYAEDGFGYIVMERCDMDFYPMLRSLKDLNEQSLVPIARDMFAGLACIHGFGIMHRDLKPDNFMYRRNMLKLCDFGLSECMSAKKPFAKGVSGTPPFMSPEMLSDSGATYGLQTDVWSVGVIMYAILLGEFPYMPSRPNGKAMKEMIKAGLPAPSFRSALAADTKMPSVVSIDLLHKLLDREPSTRATALEALNHAWFTVSPESVHSRHSLQPLIMSAKRAGAFAVRRVGGQNDPFECMDPRLLTLQQQSSWRREPHGHAEKDIKLWDQKWDVLTSLGSYSGDEQVRDISESKLSGTSCRSRQVLDVPPRP